VKNVYLMHIPKTGGQYFSDSLISALNEGCKNKNLNTRKILKDGHRGWSEVDQDSYIISIFRNPINRTISHYLYYNPPTIQSMEEIKISLLKFVELNDFMHNYQSKFICSDQINYAENLNNQFFTYDLDKLSSRLNRINKKIKTNSISPKLCLSIYKECCDVLDIEPVSNISFPDYRSPLYLSPLSKEMRQNLKKEEIDFLTDINKQDFELWESAS
jgi:hypothetical protein